jgi:hypothetical protein
MSSLISQTTARVYSLDIGNVVKQNAIQIKETSVKLWAKCYLTQDTDQWRALVDTVLNVPESVLAISIGSSRTPLLHRVFLVTSEI